MIETVSETGSTNADLAARLRNGERIAEGNWLIAESQTAGRGRQGRTWFDGKGNFMGSTIVRLTSSCPDPHSLALVAGLALYEAILPTLSEPASLKLKWPNDLMLKDAKLSGILMERVGDAIVLGAGVNLAKAPDLPDRPTIAVADVSPAPKVLTFADTLAQKMQEELQRWRSYGIEPVIRRWLAAAYPMGTAMAVHDTNGDVIHGTFDGLADDAALLLRLADGSTRVIHAGDVTLRGNGANDAAGC